MEADIWNRRYAGDDFVYGTEANRFLAEQLYGQEPGKILLPGEGEGRNALFAAAAGWEVDAFDQSEAGKIKAERLLETLGLKLNYQVAGVENFPFPKEQYDAIAIIYLHIPGELRKAFFENVYRSLKKGGLLVMEVFHLEQLHRNTGGPKDPKLLYSLEEIEGALKNMAPAIPVRKQIELDEGPLHQGVAEVIRFSGRKI